MNIGNKIKKLRIQNSLTQVELANLLNVTQQNIQRIETGKQNTTMKRLSMFAKVFNVPVEIFFQNGE